jgi:hypothetical protein
MRWFLKCFFQIVLFVFEYQVWNWICKKRSVIFFIFFLLSVLKNHSLIFILFHLLWMWKMLTYFDINVGFGPTSTLKTGMDFLQTRYRLNLQLYSLFKHFIIHKFFNHVNYNIQNPFFHQHHLLHYSHL